MTEPLKWHKWNGTLDGYLKSNLDTMKEVIKKDWDFVIAVDGYEGSGKSVLAMQMAAYCDPTLNLDRIVFNPEDFKKAIRNAKKYESVIYDEAYGGMSSRAAISEVNRSLMTMLAEIRQKNLFVFLVLPCFFELDKYAAIWRSKALLHVYTGKDFERGKFAFYSQNKKKTMYVMGKKFYNYNVVKSDFYGSFVKGYPVDEEAYKQKKYDALKARTDDEKPVANQHKKWLEQRNICMAILNQEYGVSTIRLGEILGIDSSSVSFGMKSVKKMYEKPPDGTNFSENSGSSTDSVSSISKLPFWGEK